MKMSPALFADITQAIAPLDTAERRVLYAEGRFHRSELVKDLDKRYRWDLFWLADALSVPHNSPQAPRLSQRTETLADSHIDTALRQIVPPLNEVR